MQTHWRLAKNAIANLTRGGAAGVAAVFLPAVLVRHMSQINYSVWVLVLQVAAYGSYFEFGLQTAVGRYIAIANEKHDAYQRDTVFSTAFAALSIAAIICIGLLIGVACAAGWIFPSVPAALLSQMRWALLIVGSSIALGLPSAAWTGVFVGLQRNEFIAIVTGSSKLVSAIGLVIAAIHSSSLVSMAIVVATVNLASYLLLYILVRKFSHAEFHRHFVRQSTAKELFRYCFGLMIWSFSTILVSGLDLILVGRFELTALAPYAIAATLVNFIAGIQNAVFSATMPHAAVLHARNDSVALGNMVISFTRLGVLLLILTGMPLLIYADPILRIWVGQPYAVQGHLLLTILLIANIVRLSGAPYAIVLVATGQQKLVTISPLMEGITNLIASTLLGAKFGAPGVAAGTLVGAIVGIIGHVFYNMPRTRTEILLHIRGFIFSAVGLPVLTAIPLIILAVHVWKGSPPSPLIFASAFTVTILASTAIVLRTIDAKNAARRLNARN